MRPIQLAGRAMRADGRGGAMLSRVKRVVVVS